ncbi:DUF3987 domain-containing protein [Psychrobacter frigidicola]|uniref:DUF3987 domain-containing protein n=1 Tax=Psychrobacter frigidicola TaxID=45611 RepID=A0A5C6ZZJ7_9GAMM|nr:DUF3987 domain-containing protein [Psychrobacter frigidicola]TXD96531.1 DUF3987 domain-containing protein [Psychrobacter frigidicola]
MIPTTQKNTNEKAHADDTGGFIEYIADFDNATLEQRAQDASLSQLDSLHDLGLSTNHIDNTRFLHDNLSMRGGNNKGEKAGNTKGGFGLVMVNNKAEPVNVAAYITNSDNVSFISDTTQASAYAIGSMNQNSDWWLVTTLSDAVTLYASLTIDDPNVSVLACLNPSLFYKTLKHFSEIKTIKITDTAEHRSVIEKRLSGVNAVCYFTVDTIINRLNDGEPISNIIEESQFIDLSILAWGEPEPLANDPSQPTLYPIDAFKGLLKNVVQAVAHYSQVPDAMAGQCVLGALAHMGQRFIDAPMGHGHMPTSLMLITEGESGSGKTQAMGLTHFKIKEYERQQYANYLDNVATWESDKASLKGKEQASFIDENPKPKNPKTLFDDATIEPILDRFISGEMNNASWTTDEAGQFFNGHTMTGDTAGSALSALTKLWSDGEVSRLRSQKSAYATPQTDAHGVRMTLLLQGQRVVLEQALTDPLMNGQGFLARALIACPPDLRGKRIWDNPQRRNDSPYDNPDLIEYWLRCLALLDPLPASKPNDITGTSQRIKMQWADQQAEQVFYKHMQAIENRQANGQTLEYLKAYASRMAENASRIASLMAFFEGRKTVTIDDITRAFMLVEYSTAERLRYLDATPTGEQNDSEKLSGWLVDKAKGKQPHKLSRTYIANNAPNPMRKNTKLLQNELDKLETAKHIRQEIEGRSKVIFINPKLYN